MTVKKLVVCMCLISGLSNLKAQKQPYQPIMYKLIVKELVTPPQFERLWGFGGAHLCKGKIVSILSCLLDTDYGRFKVKGKIPDKFLDIELDEPSYQSIEEMLATQKKQDTIDDLGGLSLVNSTIALLGKQYSFSIKNVVDTAEVWCLKTIDTSKLRHFIETNNFEDRYAGPTAHDIAWEGHGQEVSYLCRIISGVSQAIVYNETNIIDLLDFVNPPIPYKDMKNFDALNSFLEEYYGLRFIKRRQLEKLRLVEFR
jgi:hypothetical protein